MFPPKDNHNHTSHATDEKDDLDDTPPHGPDLTCQNFSLSALVDRYPFLRHVSTLD